MQTLTPLTFGTGLVTPADNAEVLGNVVSLNLDEFPELNWLRIYLKELSTLQQQHQTLTEQIQAIMQSGDVFLNQWIEPYTKTKNGKTYTYYQLRWLTGERQASGKPRVKTKHLSQRSVGRVQAAIARGHQVKALKTQQRVIEEQILRLKAAVQGTARHINRIYSQNF